MKPTIKTTVITTCLLFILFNSFSNTGKMYSSSKEGITIISIGDFADTIAQQKTLDFYLDFIIQKTNRQNLDPKILILLGPFGVHRPGRDFISVAYNNFSKTDTVYVDTTGFNTYKNIYDLSTTKNWFLNEMYPDALINSSFKSPADQGLILRFYGEFDPSLNYYDRILSIISYALKNIEQIKEKQQYIQMPYHLKYMHISMLTFDTNKLNSVRVTNFGFDPDSSGGNKKNILPITGGIIALLLLILLFIRNQKKLS